MDLPLWPAWMCIQVASNVFVLFPNNIGGQQLQVSEDRHFCFGGQKKIGEILEV